ncbi:hypothetical protein M3Y97_00655500 [Aphelenchoides bicaudatus]|nr:hypothetical protein M3Y97_00655500 [Aphelenchoides bicaudatus]
MQKKLRVAFFRYYPMVNFHCLHKPTMHKSSRCPTPGLVVEILQLIAKHLNVTIEVATARANFNEEDWRSVRNGTIDLLSSTDERNEEREKDFDFTEDLYEVSSVLAVRRADTSLTDMFDFFRVYSTQVWFSFGRCSGCNLFKVTETAWGFLLVAGNVALLTFAFLQCSIVVSLFQSWILSSIVRMKAAGAVPFGGLEYFQDLKTSSFSPFYEFRNAMVNNPVIELESEEQVLNALADGNKLVVMQDDERIYFRARAYCDYIFMNSPFPANTKRFMMRKKHPMLPYINAAIKAQKILILRAHRKYVTYRTPSHCIKQQLHQPALSLRPYYGVLMLFAFGAFLAISVFGAEVASVRFKWR